MASTIRILGLLSTSALCLVASAQANAQTESGQDRPASQAAEPETGLSEIVVTAQKRAENLQDVPIAITAVSGEDLQTASIRSVRDLTTAVPGLVVSQAGGTTQTFLRGIGTSITVANADPSVATYIDGVYQSMSMVSSVRLSDVQSVEVLKGPQGTLYGRNSTGGAISITTRTPTETFEGMANAGYGNFNRREVGASLSGPIAKHLYLGVYGNYEARDAYSKLENGGGVPRPNVRSYDFNWATRAKLVYDNDDDFRAVLSGDIARLGSLQDMAWQQVQVNGAGYGTSTIGPPAVRNTRQYSFGTDIPVDNNWVSRGGSLRMEYDIGDTRLVSITAYRNSRAYLRSDADATEATTAVSDVALTNRSKQTTQELQLQSTGSGPLKWVVGGFYYKDRASVTLQFTPPTIRQVLDSGADTESFSAFAQLDWSLSPNWSVTLGGRYTDETKTFTGTRIVNSTNPAAPTTTVFPRSSTHYGKFNPKVGVQYRFDNTMLYVSYSQAFKAGVYNLTATSLVSVGPVNPERLDAYEVGLKSELFDRTVRFNASVFHYDFKDLQVQSFSGGTATLLLLNAAQARYTGVDIDAVWAVTPTFQLGAKTLYMDAEYASFPVYAGFAPRTTSAGGNVVIPGGVNLTGKRPARSPEFTGTFTASYKVPLASGAQFMVNGLVNHTSSYSFTPDGTVRTPAYATVDGSIEYTSADEAWKVSVWAKNLTDKYYYNYMQVNNAGTYGIAAAPRTFGATVSLKFGGK